MDRTRIGFIVPCGTGAASPGYEFGSPVAPTVHTRCPAGHEGYLFESYEITLPRVWDASASTEALPPLRRGAPVEAAQATRAASELTPRDSAPGAGYGILPT